MKNIMKKMALASAALSLAFLISLCGMSLVRAVYNDGTATGSTNLRTGNIKIQDTGIYDSAGTLRYTPGATNLFTGNLSSTGGNQSMGAVGTALSSLNTTGFSAGDIYYAYLGGTNNAVEGSALIALSSSTASGTVISVQVASTTVGLTSFVGCASAAVSTGSVVGIYGAGSWAMCLTTGTVLAGDQLATSSLSAGYLYAPTSNTNTLLPSTATVGIALTAGTAAGGRTRVRLK